jgi:hypothetical protein
MEHVVNHRLLVFEGILQVSSCYGMLAIVGSYLEVQSKEGKRMKIEEEEELITSAQY